MRWIPEKYIGLDFETSGTLPEYALQPWRLAQQKAWITSLATVHKGKDGTVIRDPLFPTRDEIREVLLDVIERKLIVVGWNIQFDVQWLIALDLWDLVRQIKWLDGMLLWRHYFIEPEYDTTRAQKKGYGLKECVAEVLPQHAGYEDEVDFHSTDPAELEKLRSYNVRDTGFSLYLTAHWFKKLAVNPQRLRAALIEAACIPYVAKANHDGMLIDTIACSELNQYLLDTAAKKLADLKDYGVTEKIVRSPLKLARLLYDEWGLPVLKTNKGKKTGKISRATDKEVLHELAFTDPRAKTLREFREALNNRTKFACAPADAAKYNENGKAHPHAFVFGTYSGRLTYASKQGKNKDERQTGFALHQEKREGLYRRVVVAPPGYTIVEFDAAGQEFRWMAIASGDETMLALCAPGEDAHMYMGARIVSGEYKDMQARLLLKDPVAKDARQLGKVGNLSLQYRTSAAKLRVVARVQYNIPLEMDDAVSIHKTYQLSYPGVPKYWKVQIDLTKQTKYVETMAGRRVQVEGDWSKDGWSMGSTAINYRIQGTGADQKYLAMMCLQPAMQDHGAQFAWDLHDGIYFYVPDERVEAFTREAHGVLSTLPYKQAWDFEPPIELPWDCKIGKSWGTLKELRL